MRVSGTTVSYVHCLLMSDVEFRKLRLMLCAPHFDGCHDGLRLNFHLTLVMEAPFGSRERRAVDATAHD